MAWVCLGREHVYLIDPPELKPVGFVEMGCPPHRKVPRRGPLPRLSCMLQNLVVRSYTGIFFVFRDIPALVPNLTCSFLPASYFFFSLPP